MENKQADHRSPRRVARRQLVTLVIPAIGAAALFGAYRLWPLDREARLESLNLSALKRAARDRPNDAELFLVLGRRLRQAGELHPAYVMTNRAYDLSDGEPKYTAARVGALVDSGSYDEAYRLGKDAAARWPDSGEVRAQLSQVYAGRGYFVDALREAEAAVERAPRHAPAWQALGNACSQNRRPDRGFAAFERAVALNPQDAWLLADYAQALVKYGRAAEAEAHLRRSMALAPRAARPVGLLGQLKADRAHTPEERGEARAMLEQALARAPQATELSYHLAVLHLRDGRHGEAIRRLKQCLEQDPGYGEAHLALGQAYQKARQSTAARRAFAAWREFSDNRRQVGHLELRLRRSPKDLKLLRTLARLHGAQGRPHLAAEYRRRIEALQAGVVEGGPGLSVQGTETGAPSPGP
jgi:tetratricopeptide (TPR) repeat protein